MVDTELSAIEIIVVTAILDAFRYIIFDNFQTDLFWLLDSTYHEDEYSVMCVYVWIRACEFVIFIRVHSKDWSFYHLLNPF